MKCSENTKFIPLAEAKESAVLFVDWTHNRVLNKRTLVESPIGWKKENKKMIPYVPEFIKING